jgi:hypothetical protein
MEFPKASGIAAVQGYAAMKGQIWRETGTGDVGIDGQLEFVTPAGFATGRIIAVQVKAGPSFFQTQSESGWKFPLVDKHRNYWVRDRGVGVMFKRSVRIAGIHRCIS